MNKTISVFSEIGPLKKVLMHRPGEEFLNLTPNTLSRLLFDDIPYLKIAQMEHDAFANALRAEGVEVVYLVDLVAEALEAGGRAVRKKFIEQFIREAGVTSPKIEKYCFDFLDGIKDNREMIKKCIAGIDVSELKSIGSVSGFYATRDTGKMIIDPIPNIYFQRDPMASVGHGATLHKCGQLLGLVSRFLWSMSFVIIHFMKILNSIMRGLSLIVSKAGISKCFLLRSWRLAFLKGQNQMRLRTLP
jgi:arginine deiminase